MHGSHRSRKTLQGSGSRFPGVSCATPLTPERLVAKIGLPRPSYLSVAGVAELADALA